MSFSGTKVCKVKELVHKSSFLYPSNPVERLSYLLRLPSFDYYSPKTVKGALDILSKEGSIVLAGGTTLIRAMKKREVYAKSLVNVKNIEELRTISIAGDDIVLGAVNTISALLKSDVVFKHL